MDHYDLDVLKQMAEAVESKAHQMGLPVVFAGVDDGGNLMLLHRMAGSLLVSLNTAVNKAYTAAAFQQPTANLKDPSSPTGDIPGIPDAEDGRVVIDIGAGLPIFVDGRLAGGIGVSGGTPDGLHHGQARTERSSEGEVEMSTISPDLVRQVIEDVVKEVSRQGAIPGGGRRWHLLDMDSAISAADKAWRQYLDCSMKDRARFIQAVRDVSSLDENVEYMAKATVEETGMGRVDDKIFKNKAAALQSSAPKI